MFIVECNMWNTNNNRDLVSEVIEYMRANSYEIYEFIGGLRRPSDGAFAQIDVVFVLRYGFFRKNSAWS